MANESLRNRPLPPDTVPVAPHCSAEGFTLLELLAVIFIVSLVCAVSFASFPGIGERKIQSDAKRIGSIVRHLADTALTSKETLPMKINVRSKAVTYTLPDGEKSERFGDMAAITTQSGGTVSDGEVVIFFGPLGAGESFEIHLRDGASAVGIGLNALSGRVKIRDEGQAKGRESE